MIANDLIAALWQGGKFGYYFTLPRRKTSWRSITNPDSRPEDDIHVYFGVHPTNEKVTGRASVQDIACINCLFAEFDNKDFFSRGCWSGSGWTSLIRSNMVPTSLPALLAGITTSAGSGAST